MGHRQPSHENPSFGIAVNRRAQVRSAKSTDLPQLLAIERESFAWPWTESDFVSALRANGCFALIYEDTRLDRIAGYALIAELGQSLAILNLAVALDYRFQGVATTLLGQLVQCTAVRGPCSIQAVVPEDNRPAHRFFRSLGFRRMHTIHSGGSTPETQQESGYFVLQPWR